MIAPGLPGGIQWLPANEYRRERWPNGAGWTRHIASATDADARLVWRLSIAEIARDADYSLFPGMRRHQVLLQGDGLSLTVGEGPGHRLEPPHGSICFPGDVPARCTLAGGPVHVLNLFHRTGLLHATLWRRPVVGPMYFFPGAGETWALHLLAGRAELGEAPGSRVMERGDTAVLGAGDGEATGPGRVPLLGGGELLVIRLSPAADPPPD